MTALPDEARLWHLVCDGALQAAALTLVAWLVERWFWRRAPALVTACWWAVVLRLLVPAQISSPLSLAPGLALPAAAESTLAPWFGVWVCGAAALLILGLARARHERQRLLVNSRPSGRALSVKVAALAGRLRLARVPAVRVSDRDGPSVVGVWRPVIVLPRGMVRAVGSPALEHVLLHELAHVRRRDGWQSMVLLVVQAAWWPHPAAWLARRRLEALRELACDRVVACQGPGGALAYRRTLLELARPWITRPRPLALAFVHPSSLLITRLRALECGVRERRALPVLACATLLACVGPMVRQTSSAPLFELSELSELEGCMRKRLAVMAALATEAGLEQR